MEKGLGGKVKQLQVSFKKFNNLCNFATSKITINEKIQTSVY